ncbi:spore germination protein [Ureibacillus sp. 179-F W5.1 NHS]|uniref:spore germination protein n=1 Tax=Ureibacillus sp. 179-F W5.1 NHS TaxID=3374297 RepID=UPI003879621A
MFKKIQQKILPNEEKPEYNPPKIPVPPLKNDFINELKKIIHSPADLVIRFVTNNITIAFIDGLIETQSLDDNILARFEDTSDETPSTLRERISIPEVNVFDEMIQCIDEMLIGAVLIHINGHPQVVLAKIPSYEKRSLEAPENESQVIGTQVGFNESLNTNITLIRRFITNPNLCNEHFTLGKETRTSVSVLYIHGIVDEKHVNTVRQRIKDLDIVDLIDSAILAELIDDSSSSIFPQTLLTERPDRFCDGLLTGKVGIIVNGSSMGIICPFSFLEFFQSREDQNLRWPIASFIRLLRFAAIIVSIFFTPIYVASLTFHYEVIPQPMLVPLSESRAIVPFPPIIEALFLELVIELLREAGARLPTKVGQTIGIVGGIVIGTAAVQAGITSNILIIFVALGALASFTTPNYMMGNVIRIIRFPIIVLAGFWGYYGIMLAFCFLLIHLLKQSSLGAPYLAPFYPPRLKDWPDSIVRLPLPFISRHSVNSRSRKEIEKNKKKKNTKKQSQNSNLTPENKEKVIE